MDALVTLDSLKIVPAKTLFHILLTQALQLDSSAL